ncbi:MAG: pyridoxamine 5'-phosphate oxidase family protein [Chloroflexi bacterium]|nr:pyridoxamine 5'-phosphate oxidase family protein [Chloroflexota bacterium]
MTILEQHPDLLDALRGEMTPKFLATRNATGVPNVVPCISLQPADDQPDTVFFGNFLLRKSIKNLNEDSRVGILVITPALRGWILKCDFVEFQRTGMYVDQVMGGSLLRYNAYTGIRDAGILRVRSVENTFAFSKMQVMTDYVRARWAGIVKHSSHGAGVTMPRQVQNEFAKMIAVKVLAWISDEGYPMIVPTLSMQPAGAENLVCRTVPTLPHPPTDAQVATNILTFEAISYQAKGKWELYGDTGKIRVQEVYAGGPPLPGGRVA